MTALNQLEIIVVENAIGYLEADRASILRDQVKLLSVRERIINKVGFYTYFCVDLQAPKLPDKKIMLFTCGEIAGVHVEFNIPVENGIIQCIEAHTCGVNEFPYDKSHLLVLGIE